MVYGDFYKWFGDWIIYGKGKDKNMYKILFYEYCGVFIFVVVVCFSFYKVSWLKFN